MSDDEASGDENDIEENDIEENDIPEPEEHSDAQVYDGNTWEKLEGNDLEDDAELPMSPVEDGNGEIFVTIPSFRGMCTWEIREIEILTIKQTVKDAQQH